jgi:hypothetical protein
MNHAILTCYRGADEPSKKSQQKKIIEGAEMLSKHVHPDWSSSAMPRDVLGLIFQQVALLDRHDPSPKMSVLLTCSRFMEIALECAFTPWGESGRGLMFALENNFFRYYAHWSKKAGARWRPSQNDAVYAVHLGPEALGAMLDHVSDATNFLRACFYSRRVRDRLYLHQRILNHAHVDSNAALLIAGEIVLFEHGTRQAAKQIAIALLKRPGVEATRGFLTAAIVGEWDCAAWLLSMSDPATLDPSVERNLAIQLAIMDDQASIARRLACDHRVIAEVHRAEAMGEASVLDRYKIKHSC